MLAFQSLSAVAIRPRPAAARPPATRSPAVLLAVADEQVRAAVLAALAGRSARVQTADTITDALWLAEQEAPDLVVLAAELADGAAQYALGQLRTRSSTRHVPVLVCSVRTIDGRHDYALERELLRVGATAYFTCPHDLSRLAAETGRWLPCTARPPGDA